MSGPSTELRTGPVQISASFNWGRTAFVITGWAERGRWISAGAIDVMSLADPLVHHAASSVVQAAREVALFLAKRSTGEEDKSLADFAGMLSHSPITAASALGALVTAMAAVERPEPDSGSDTHSENTNAKGRPHDGD